jgi:polyisoprenoid-binding protein YceI
MQALLRIIGIVLCLLPIELIGQNTFITEKGRAEFISTAPMLTFSGISENLNGLVNLESGALDFFLDLNTLKTGVGLRDRHMRTNYLETSKYPFAEFTGKIDNLPKNLTSKTPVSAKGKFKIHGVERDIVVEGFLSQKGNQLLLEATWTLLLKDYNIEVPKVVFYELAEEQTIKINASLNQKKQ